MKSKEGETLYRRLEIRIIPPAGEKEERIVYRAGPHRRYTAAQIEPLLDQVASAIEKQNPNLNFRLVELAPNRFNFIYAGLRSEAIAQAG